MDALHYRDFANYIDNIDNWLQTEAQYAGLKRAVGR